MAEKMTSRGESRNLMETTMLKYFNVMLTLVLVSRALPLNNNIQLYGIELVFTSKHYQWQSISERGRCETYIRTQYTHSTRVVDIYNRAKNEFKMTFLSSRDFVHSIYTTHQTLFLQLIIAYNCSFVLVHPQVIFHSIPLLGWVCNWLYSEHHHYLTISNQLWQKIFKMYSTATHTPQKAILFLIVAY